MFDLRGRQGFSEGISEHFASGTENKNKFAIIDDPANKVESDVDVFGASVVR